MRLHVVGLPHTQTTHKYLHCAYTQKILKFCDMMTDEGHEVILYAGEQNEARCAEHVVLASDEWREAVFGPWDENGLFSNIDWNPDLDYWKQWNSRAISEIAARSEPQDMLCLVMGWSQAPIARVLRSLLPVEWAIGYEGIVPDFYHIFESYAWMHTVYGQLRIGDGRAFDAVIPNFFDPSDFALPHAPWPEPEESYLLFIGRLTLRKAPHAAAQIAERCGIKIKVAGPGAIDVQPGRIDCGEILIEGDHVEYVGPVGLEERARLMHGALATIVPTQYVEPFGGVAVESMMCGTPVVASDWGAFTEMVIPEVSGYRYHTLAEAAHAVERAISLDRDGVKAFAESNYSLAAVGPQFTRTFERLSTLYSKGWYA